MVTLANILFLFGLNYLRIPEFVLLINIFSVEFDWSEESFAALFRVRGYLRPDIDGKGKARSLI